MATHTQNRAECGLSEVPGPTVTVPALLGACAVVLTASVLGASWLSTPILGLPAGVWTVPLLYVAIVRGGRAITNPVNRSARADRAMGSPANAVRRRLGEAFSRFSRAASGSLDVFAELPSRLALASVSRATDTEPDDELAPRVSNSRRSDHNGSGSVPRIAVIEPRRHAMALLQASGSERAQWAVLDLRQPIAYDGAFPRADASLTTCEPETLVVTLGDGNQSSGPSWRDWSEPCEASYPGVFPVRLDPESVTIRGLDPQDAAQVRIAVQLAEAAVLLRRQAEGVAGGEPGAANIAMELLRSAVIGAAVRDRHDEPARVAASVVSAWLVGGNSGLDVDEVLEGTEAAARVSKGDSGDATMSLRLAAARFAAGEDELAFHALDQAAELIGTRTDSHAGDQAMFVQSELELAREDDELAVGRIAAGICLCLSRAAPGVAEHLAGDLLDDMQYSPALLGRDQDRAVLMRVLRHMRRRSSLMDTELEHAHAA